MDEFQIKPETEEENNKINNASKDIICNICKEICLINIHGYTFDLYGCKNNHITNNILFQNFEDTQRIQHENNKNHKNEKENYYCNKHNGEQFTKYCKNHNKNICIQCENAHKDCETIYYGSIMPNENQINCEELKDYINKLKNDINDMIKKLNYVMNFLEIYYNISKNIINKFDNKNKRNYQILANTNQFINFNSVIINDIKNIIDNNKFEEYKNVINFYEFFKGIKNSNYINAELFIPKEHINKDIQIINNYYEKWGFYCSNNQINNKNIEIEIDGKIIPFSQNYKFKEKGVHILKYYINSNLSNICCFFADCENIIKIDLTNFNSDNIIDMKGMFCNCKSLKNVNLSNNNTAKVKNMRDMFYNCRSLTDIDLSNFNTEIVENMKSMFSYCESLKNVDLSNFNTENVENMMNMFRGCKSLKNAEQIKTNDENIIHKFNECRIF